MSSLVVGAIGVTAAAGVAGAAATAYGAYSSSRSADKANDAAVATSQGDLAWQRETYGNAKTKMDRAKTRGENQYFAGTKYATIGLNETVKHSNLYNQFSADVWNDRGNIAQTQAFGFDAAQGISSNMNAAQGISSNMNAAQGKAMEMEMNNFLDTFQQAIGDNNQALQDFNRRYGPIMDNVSEGIKAVSAESLSAQGREQLSLDAETLGKSFTSALASRNMGRSGINVEMESRLAADTAEQARAIDINSHAQSAQLQGQGINNLNSMTAQQQGIINQGNMLQQNMAQGQLQGAANDQGAFNNMLLANMNSMNNANQFNANSDNNMMMANMNSMNSTNQFNANSDNNMMMANMNSMNSANQFNAANQTQVSGINAAAMNSDAAQRLGISSSMYGAGFGSVNQAYGNMANAYQTIGLANVNSANSFYSGQQAPNANNLVNAYNTQAANHSADASGYAQAAGTAIGNIDWGGMSGSSNVAPNLSPTPNIDSMW